MLEQILKLYTMAMLGDVRSPLPHLFGPPGCGKSTVVEQAAELIGVNLHIINVSRLSPLDVEGVQMPHGIGEEMVLRMLPATFWTSLKEGDIVLLDEFLRGFPEVYNALLDILTSRRVGAFVLPKVFIIGASNSTVAYDKALEDRLLHLPVPDPRAKKSVKNELANLIVDQLGLLPEMASSMEMQHVFDVEIFPMYAILDQMGMRTASSSINLQGRSIRNLIGQVRLREIQSDAMLALIGMNNTFCKTKDKHQYMVLADGNVDDVTINKLRKLHDDPKVNAKLTEVQRLNVKINLELVGLEAARKEGTTVADDDIDDFFTQLK